MLRDQGLRVPEDIAIVSYEKWNLGEAILPSLTSVDLRANDVAREAIRMLLEDIESSDSGKERPARSITIEPGAEIPNLSIPKIFPSVPT